MPQSFEKTDLLSAKQLLKERCIGVINFSHGTYQIEVLDRKDSKTYWPFFQLSPEGEYKDGFCYCEKASQGKGCVHLAAAFLTIYERSKFPLHTLFEKSFWNAIFTLNCRRHGYDTRSCKGSINTGLSIISETGKNLFSIKAKTSLGESKIKEYITERTLETEENSIKFSNLSKEEIELWKKGRPSPELRYELSFWSDLAKWFFIQQYKKEPYKVSYLYEDKNLPSKILISTPDLDIEMYIAEVNWGMVIPTLATVESDLRLINYKANEIETITYDEVNREFHLEFNVSKYSPAVNLPDGHKIAGCEDWLYIPYQGFTPAFQDLLLQHECIKADKIAYFLKNHAMLVKAHMEGVQLTLKPVEARYIGFIDEASNLCLEAYVFEIGDLSSPQAACYGKWVYIPSKGFFYLDNHDFEQAKQVIPRQQVSDFVTHHRHFLQTIPGLETHLGYLEVKYEYEITAERNIRFFARFDLNEVEEIVDFGEWVYLKSRGFYSKLSKKRKDVLRHRYIVFSGDIPKFIYKHTEELENVEGFFSMQSPLEKSGLQIYLDAEGKIIVEPRYVYKKEYEKKEVLVFGDYTYVAGEGFFEIPALLKIPEPYSKKTVIKKAEEIHFLSFEIDLLRGMILNVDPVLIKPENITFTLKKVAKTTLKSGVRWQVELVLTSEFGSIPLREVWQAINENKTYLFSKAGLILLKQPQLKWFKNISKTKWKRDTNQLLLTSLEWIRLNVMEEVRLDDGITSSKSMMQLLTQMQELETEKEIDLSGLKSVLRPYQEKGLKWLWYMYNNGLSAMLCDEMGLGKTHQAMALLAAVRNSLKGKEKYLIVCPTSVIYHWEDLLMRFFPSIRVKMYYGPDRNLEGFEDNQDVLLTTYGILRAEKEGFKNHSFELAIFDEMHLAKNIKSQTHRALRRIEACMRVGLTGTPIENNLMELKALFDVIVPTYMPQESVFRDVFVNPIEKNHDEKRRYLLQKLIKPFMLRRKKSEVLMELPEKIEEIAYCELSEEQKKLYRSAYLGAKEEVLKDLSDESKPIPYLHIFSLLSSLKRICDHPSLIKKDVEHYKAHESGKWEYFTQILEEILSTDQKVVVFSQYLDMIKILELYLKEREVGFAEITGSTKLRAEEIKRFKEDPSCRVFIASLQAAGVGIDLVSASIVIHYDRWWNPAKENQATDRVHRIGQTRGVQVFKLVTKSTIEEHIHQLIEKKVHLAEGVIGYDEQEGLKQLSRHELMEIFKKLDQDIL